MQCLILLGLWVANAWSATCPEPLTGLSDVAATVDAGTNAFTSQDLEGLQRSRSQAISSLPCLSEPMTPEVAADLHRLIALNAFTEGDRARSQAELAVARRLQPSVNLIDGLVLVGHPFSQLYIDAATPLTEPEPIEAPRGQTVLVDGLPDQGRYPDALAVVQYINRSDAVQQTFLLAPGDPVPVLERSMRLPLLVTTGVTAAASGAFYALSWRAHDQFWDLDASSPDLEAQRARVNRRVIASTGLGASALVAGTLTVVLW